MPKISARKLILCELIHLNFKRKNNVRGKACIGVANFYGKTLERRVLCFG